MINSLSPQAVQEAMKQGVTIIDGRSKQAFIEGFIPGSIHLVPKNIERYVLSLVRLDTPIIIVEDESQSIGTALTQLGYSHILGKLDGGIASWTDAGYPLDMIIAIEADEFNMDIPYDDKMAIIDVRDAADFQQEHIASATNMPIDSFADIVQVAALDDDSNIYLHCGGGTKSILAASIIKQQGLHNVRVIDEDFKTVIAQPNVQTVLPKPSDNLPEDLEDAED